MNINMLTNSDYISFIQCIYKSKLFQIDKKIYENLYGCLSNSLFFVRREHISYIYILFTELN